MDIPNTPAGGRLRWLVEHTGEGAASSDEIADQFEPAFLDQVGLDRIVDFLNQSTYMRTAPLVEIRTGSRGVDAKFRVEDQNVVVQLVVSEAEPHRISGLMVSAGPSLMEALDDTPGSDSLPATIIEERIAPFAAKLSAGGLVVGVLSDGATTVRSFGDAPVDGIYDVGSITKPFTGILLAEMARRGDVSLDDLVSKFLPAGVLDEAITVEQLALHTSGLPRLPPKFRPPDMSDPYATFTVEVMYDALRGIELEAAPGTRSEYSNLGYSLLGHILTRAGGSPYEELLAERVCDPLALSNTRATTEPPVGAVPGYARTGPTPWWSEPLPGPGGVSSTIGDLLAFAAANVTPSDTVIADALIDAQRPRFDESERAHVGLGWAVMDREDGTPVVWHNGGTGGFRSFIAFHPASRTAVAALSNNGDENPDVPVITVLAGLLNTRA